MPIKPHQIIFRLSTEEYTELLEQAESEKMKPNEYARDVVLNRYPDVKNIQSKLDGQETQLGEMLKTLHDMKKYFKLLEQGIIESIDHTIRSANTSNELAKTLLKEDEYKRLKNTIDALMKRD